LHAALEQIDQAFLLAGEADAARIEAVASSAPLAAIASSSTWRLG